MANNKDQFNQPKQKKKQQQSKPRISGGKKFIMSVCRWGPPSMYLFSFLEADNWLQSGLLFVWRGMGWPTVWIGQIDVLLVFGVGFLGYFTLWGISEFLLERK